MAIPVCDITCGVPGGAGALGGIYSATRIQNLVPFIIPFGAPEVVPMDNVMFDVGPATEPDLDGDQILILQDGIYQLNATYSFTSPGDGSDVAVFITLANGVGLVSNFFFSEPVTAKGGSLSVLVELSAGDAVQVRASNASVGTTPTITATLSAEKRN
jgi:hypothetical protein